MLNAEWTGPEGSSLVVVLLHGFSMRPSDLAPFGASMQSGARFAFPEGPAPVQPSGRSWWNVDYELRAHRLSECARDLAHYIPPGLESSRLELEEFMTAVQRGNPNARIVIGGFSQGGMLACDLLLEKPSVADGLVLLSSSRIDYNRWQKLASSLKHKPVLVAHGRQDGDISFDAGFQLSEWLRAAGADVTWLPFDGGHEMPLPVWRAFRRFLTRFEQ